MLSQIFLVFWACFIGVVVFAWWRGGTPERIGASAVLATAIIVEIIHASLPKSAQAGALLLTEGVLALTFLVAAMRYVRPWLGIAMVLEGIQFSLHAYFFVADKPHNYLYSIVNNLITIGVLLCLVVGTWLNHRRKAASAAS